MRGLNLDSLLHFVTLDLINFTKGSE